MQPNEPWSRALEHAAATKRLDQTADFSSFTAQFVHNEWIESYDPTIEDSYRTQVSVDVSSSLTCIHSTRFEHAKLTAMFLHRVGKLYLKCEIKQLIFMCLPILTKMDGSLDTAGTEQFGMFLESSHIPQPCHTDPLIVAMRDLYMKTGQGFLLVFSISSASSLAELAGLRDEIIRIKDDDNVPIVICGNKADLEDQRAVPRTKGFSLSQRWGAPYYESSARTRSKRHIFLGPPSIMAISLPYSYLILVGLIRENSKCRRSIRRSLPADVAERRCW